MEMVAYSALIIITGVIFYLMVDTPAEKKIKKSFK